MMMKQTQQQAGFTLVELVLVIVILGIVASVGSSRFFNLSVYQERGAFDDVKAALRYAQKRARAAQCRIQVNFVVNTSYELKEQNGSCNTGDPFTRDVRNPGSGESTYANADISTTLNPSTNSIIFNTDGSASTDATITIGSDKPRTIRVVQQTGLICESGVNGCP